MRNKMSPKLPEIVASRGFLVTARFSCKRSL